MALFTRVLHVSSDEPKLEDGVNFTDASSCNSGNLKKFMLYSPVFVRSCRTRKNATTSNSCTPINPLVNSSLREVTKNLFILFLGTLCMAKGHLMVNKDGCPLIMAYAHA